MLIYSMGVSVDGFIADREGAFGWTVPDEEQFRFHTAQVRELGSYLCGRRLYETMLPWETDPSMRDDELRAAFADVWCAIPKVVFSRTLDSVQGNARLAEASVAEEAATALDATDKDVGIGGAGLAAAAVELGLVDELRLFPHPVVVGGGTPFLPPVTEDVPLDLIETRTCGSRVIYERYGRPHDESPAERTPSLASPPDGDKNTRYLGPTSPMEPNAKPTDSRDDTEDAWPARTRPGPPKGGPGLPRRRATGLAGARRGGTMTQTGATQGEDLDRECLDDFIQRWEAAWNSHEPE